MEDDTNDHIVLINRKSYVQLQEHFDDIVQSERMSRLCDPNCDRLQQLNRTMRLTRQQVTAPLGRVAEAIIYRNTGLPTPFGAPTTFNPDLTRHAVIGTTNGQTAPWVLAAPPLPVTINDMSQFKSKTWCVTCGFRKLHHLKEESFGNRCRRNYCANCMQLKQHDHSHRMGPRCTNPRKETSPYVHWFNCKFDRSPLP